MRFGTADSYSSKCIAIDREVVAVLAGEPDLSHTRGGASSERPTPYRAKEGANIVCAHRSYKDCAQTGLLTLPYMQHVPCNREKDRPAAPCRRAIAKGS